MLNLREHRSGILAYIVFAIICYADWYLFQSYVLREKSWSPFLNGDANWYLSQSYETFDHIKNHGELPGGLLENTSGFMIYLFSSLLYFLFGASRLVALTTNFFFLPIFLFCTFIVSKRLSNSWMMALASVGLSLSIGIPFQAGETYPMLNIASYQRDLVGFFLFAIFVAVVLLSNTFSRLKWGIIAGIAAGLTVVFRYNMIYHFVGIYLTMIFFLLMIFLWIKKQSRDSSLYKTRLINCAASFLTLLITIGYPMYLGGEALYKAYNFFGESAWQKWPFIVQTLVDIGPLREKLIYYPKHMFIQGLGTYFHSAVFHVSILIVLLIAVARYVVHYPAKERSSFPKEPNAIHSSRISADLALFGFIGISFLVPLSILTIYPIRSWNAALLLTAPPIIFVSVVFSLVYRKFYSSASRILRSIGFLIVIVAVGEGMYFQIHNYSFVSNSSHHRSSYVEVARLYDDIVGISRERETNSPRVSVNFLNNWTLGNGAALTAYQYERTGEVFHPIPKLGGSVYKEIDLATAARELLGSDLAIISMDGEIPESPVVPPCDPLQGILSNYPFAKSVLALQSDLLLILMEHFSEKAKYRICGRNVSLFLSNDAPVSNPLIAISTSSVQLLDTPSVPRPRVRLSSASKTVPYSASQIMDRDASVVWHSESIPTFPQWIEFIFEAPVEVKRIFMGRQVGRGPEGVNRAPKRFTFQGKNGGGDWVNLLEVENAGFTDGDEIKTWQLYKTPKFTTYKILIKSNNGAPDMVTINFINFQFVTDR